MSKSQRDKGKRGERQVAELLRSLGIAARRGRQYAGHPDAPDVVADLPGCYVEVKLRERESVRAWMDEARVNAGDLVPLVFHRKNRGEWLLTLPAAAMREFARSVEFAAYTAERPADRWERGLRARGLVGRQSSGPVRKYFSKWKQHEAPVLMKAAWMDSANLYLKDIIE